MDCHPALSASIPVRRAVDFLAASNPPNTSTNLANIFRSGLEAGSKSSSCGLMTIGRYMVRSLMATTVPKTLKACTMKAVVHCLNLPLLSSGDTAMTGGAMMYRNSILNIRATQFISITMRSYISAMARSQTTI